LSWSRPLETQSVADGVGNSRWKIQGSQGRFKILDVLESQGLVLCWAAEGF